MSVKLIQDRLDSYDCKSNIEEEHPQRYNRKLWMDGR